MRLYETAVRKPVSTILIFIGVIVFGAFSLKNLSVDMYPDMELPYIMVMTTYVGANASDIETNVSRILEDNLNTVDNLKNIYSTSSDNLSIVSLEFEWGVDLTEATNDIRDAVSSVRSYLPDEADDPIIIKISSSMIPVMVISATAEESYLALDKILDEQMVNRLNRINGVGAVSVMGAPVREIQINVDPRRLEAFNLSVEQIGGIIAAENINIPAGTIDIGNNTFNLKSDGQFRSSDDLYSIVIANIGGSDIYLRDVATIRDTIERQTLDERIDGRKGIRVVVQKQSGANTVSIAENIMAMLPSIQESLPEDVTLNILMDGSEYIVESIDSLTETVMLAFLFVILVVLFFLGRWRATLIICITIPVSLVAAFIYLYLTGSTLNIISLSSLTIAVALVVDDAIVVLENIMKHIERGASPREAAVYGTNEVWLAVIATTLTIVAVFLPLTMVGGMAGVMFKELGWIITLVILVSLIAAITLTPMLSAYMLKANHQHTYKGLGIIFKPIDKFLAWLDDAYSRLLTWALRHRALVLISAFLIFVGGVFLATQVPAELMPAQDSGSITMKVEMPKNTGVEHTKTIARRIDAVIKETVPELELLSTSAGTSSKTNIYTAMMGGSGGLNIVNYTLRLKSSTDRERTVFEIADMLREELDRIPDIERYTVTAGGDQMGGSSGSAIEVKIFGYDFDETNTIANDLRNQMAVLPGLRDVVVSRDAMRPEYNVELDRNRLAIYGLNSATVSSAIRNRINGLTATKYREDGDEYDVIVRFDEPFRTSLADVENILVFTPSGAAVRVGDLGTVVEEFAPPTISRENRQRVVSVNANLGAGVALGTAVAEIQTVLADFEVSPDINIEIGGSFESMQESFADLAMLLALVIMLVYIVMATQFESFVYPFIIMITILLAVPGVFFALWISNTPLSMIALIGAIMLVGIVVKSGIVMVDFTNLLRERGLSISSAVVDAGRSRLRPVLMTSVTTTLGMAPLAIGLGAGSELWQPMGIAVIGGLVFSTVLTLVVVPVMYSLFGGAGVQRQRRQIRKNRHLTA